jgi:hypothetical protein
LSSGTSQSGLPTEVEGRLPLFTELPRAEILGNSYTGW